MTDAEATVRSSILLGLLKDPEVARIVSPEGIPERIVAEILQAVFAKSVRWSVECYAEELDIKDKLGG